MTDLSAGSQRTEYKAKNKIRFVTAASLFDGHDASINIIRRILQASGCEVIHLGHNRSAEEVVTAALEEDGVARIYSPEDGRKLGLQGMVDDMLSRCDEDLSQRAPKDLKTVKSGDRRSLARMITALENGQAARLREQILREADAHSVPALGITGTGGSGKSSLTDELIRRFRLDQDDRLDVAVLAVDPSRRKSGGIETVVLVEPE